MVGPRTVKLAVTGSAAGLFSGLFGVGGGSIIVPLLILWLAYEERPATGTSLVAIVIVASVASIVQGVYGNVRPASALLVGGPAVAGALMGTWLQQRVRPDVISLLFAGLLIGVAVDLILS
ncbi:MAG: sulfite exporter TauE/SafE family protein [Solirubrobacteraceae bacterium]